MSTQNLVQMSASPSYETTSKMHWGCTIELSLFSFCYSKRIGHTCSLEMSTMCASWTCMVRTRAVPFAALSTSISQRSCDQERRDSELFLLLGVPHRAAAVPNRMKTRLRLANMELNVSTTAAQKLLRGLQGLVVLELQVNTSTLEERFVLPRQWPTLSCAFS